MLKEIREKSGLSQSQLSKATGISLRTLQMYEQGYRNIAHARIDVMLKLCITLNCDIEDLLDDEFKSLYEQYIGEH